MKNLSLLLAIALISTANLLYSKYEDTYQADNQYGSSNSHLSYQYSYYGGDGMGYGGYGGYGAYGGDSSSGTGLYESGYKDGYKFGYQDG